MLPPATKEIRRVANLLPYSRGSHAVEQAAEVCRDADPTQKLGEDGDPNRNVEDVTNCDLSHAYLLLFD